MRAPARRARRSARSGEGAADASGAPRPGDDLPAGADVVVVGAGIVGAAIADRLAGAGASVCVLDSSGPAAGSSSSGEGNILVSDKLPGIDLALALRSIRLWHEVAAGSCGRGIEFEEKGGLVVAADEEQLAGLTRLADSQRAAGARVRVLGASELCELEPSLATDVAGGAFYADDCQVQPMLAVAHHLAAARRAGCRVVRRAEVSGMRTSSGRAVLRTRRGEIEAPTVVNAAGPWAGEVAGRLGARLAVTPRRGHILVTEPVPLVTAHKVSEASYVGSIHDGGAAWSCSSVVEATASGTMLLGSSREFAGWSTTPDPEIVSAIARRAVRLFPLLAGVRLLRTYVGFRPATPDRLPVIGWDGEVPGLLHAGGHEGAGIGLCQVTAELVGCLVAGVRPPIDVTELAPGRFEQAPAGGLPA